jgi:hypothetical protein
MSSELGFLVDVLGTGSGFLVDVLGTGLCGMIAADFEVTDCDLNTQRGGDTHLVELRPSHSGHSCCT